MAFLNAAVRYFWHHKKISIGIVLVLLLTYLFRPQTPPSVATQQITKGDFSQTVSVSGTVDAKTKVNLTFPISGKVVYIGAKEGDNVKAYQTIASLDERTLEANLQNAVAALQNQQISFDITNDKNGDRPLSDTGLSTSALRELQTAMNTLTQAQLAVKIQQIAQEQAILTSPINGILTRADIQTPGVTASLTSTYTVIDPSTTVLDMDVDESDIGTIHLGQPVSIVFDAYPNQTFHESVSSIDFVSHTTANGSNAFTVEVPLKNNDAYTYRVGMNANADIVTYQTSNVLTVPLVSLVNDNVVYVKVNGGFEKRSIKVGRENDTTAEVISGLSEGDVVALDPTAAAKQVRKTKHFFGLW